MSSFRDAADNDALAMLEAASFGFDDGGPANVGQLAFELAADGTAPGTTAADGQQPYGTQEEQQVALDYLDQLGFEDLLDDEGLNLYGSPLRSDAPDLPTTIDGANPTPLHGSLNAAGDAPGSSSAPNGLAAESPASSSTSPRSEASSAAAKSPEGKSAAPAAASFTINPNALSMNSSSMRLPPPTSHAAAHAPSSDESDSPSSSQSSHVRRSSPPRQVNAVAGPGPSSSRFHAPQGVVALPAGPSAPQKRARSPNEASRSQGSSPSKLPSPPPAKRKKVLPALADDDGTAPRAVATGKKRARVDSPVSDVAPSRKKSKGKERATEKPDEGLSLEQQIDKANRINASKVRLRDLAAKYDDDVRRAPLPIRPRSCLGAAKLTLLARLLPRPPQRRLLFHLQQFKLMADYDPVVRASLPLCPPPERP